MTVLVNGVPKSGTHAVMTVLALLGLRKESGIIRCFTYGTKKCVKRTAAYESARSVGAIEADGDGLFLHAHMHDRETWRGPHIFVTRNPRNILVSNVRWRLAQGLIDKIDKDALISCIDDFYDIGLVEILNAFRGWSGRDGVLTVRFEDLFEASRHHAIGGPSKRCLEIAEYLGRKAPDDLSAMAYGVRSGINLYKGAKKDFSTWSGGLSDWRAWWSNELEDAWVKSGAADIERMGPN